MDIPDVFPIFALVNNIKLYKIMDKKVFLLDRQHYRKEQVENLTEKDLEEWVAEEDYEDNYTIIKIDANDYSTPEAAIDGEMGGFCDPEDYYIFSFGF